ncbi:rod-binding protein [Pararhodobacter sp. CCB-MM2]|uniref:rod-binding protein n=1 Tax=Pararhodobacter sp. CCB-MM2 TaxID=1786003 RepID=UPI0009F5DD6A|nr:rod-binding protein [Pararhodobacter sp. CCB-MM2]
MTIQSVPTPLASTLAARAPGATALPQAPDPIRQSAEALESAFLAEMFKAADLFRPTEGIGSGGEGEEQFSSFLADEQARALVARGGLGLADSIESALRLRAQGHAAGAATQPEIDGGAA